jgi:two-component system, OmpR family, response regulator CpxR
MQKILLVEDDPLIYRLYKKIFTLEGFEIEIAENGQLGLDKLATYHPDIILLDIMMKTMNGLEMLGDLKLSPATKDIPVIVLTNVSDMKITSLATEKGAEQVLIKSETEPDTVIALVRGVLAKAAE